MVSKLKREQFKASLQAYPNVLRFARSCYIALSSVYRELVTALKLVPRLVMQTVRSPDEDVWLRELPVQAPSQLSHFAELTVLGLIEFCRVNKLAFKEGGDSLYLPPESWSRTPLKRLQSRYPAGCGLKISKSEGSVAAPYMSDRFGRRVSRRQSFPHIHQVLTFNFLHAEGLAPRLYDLVEVTDSQGRIHVAYVVEHLVNQPLRTGDRAHVIERLKALEHGGVLRLISGAGWSGIDFEEPDGNGNIIRSANYAGPLYVDVHNFILENYGSYLKALAESQAKPSHYGGDVRVLGGEVLYQSIPGLDLPAKRAPRERMRVLDGLLQQTKIQLSDKVIFEVGCNIGLMGAEYLRRGARWLHGWDVADVAVVARRILLAIGCTRFSITPGRIETSTAVEETLPDHLRRLPNRDGIVSYLEMRAHLGWHPSLAKLPWRHMLYEGHQDDGALGEHIASLHQLVPARVLVSAKVADAHSKPRHVAIIERLDVAS